MDDTLSLPPIAGRTECMRWLQEWLEKTGSTHKKVGGSIFVHPSEQVLSSCPFLTLILGETGSGKTRLATEAANMAAREGYYQIWVPCRETEMATPYFPVGEFLGALLHQFPVHLIDEIMEDVGSSVQYLGALCPQLLERFLPLSPDGNAPGARVHLGNALALLIDACRRKLGPLIFVIDDLHWMDQETLELFSYLLQSPLANASFEHGHNPSEIRPSLLILATAHSGRFQNNMYLRIWVAHQERKKQLVRLQLSALELADVTTLVHWEFASTLCDTQITLVAQQVYNLSLGNPFFANEFLHLYNQPDLLAQPKNGFPATLQSPYGSSGELISIEALSFFPELIATTMEESLMRVSGACNDWLGIASTLGYQFDVASVHQLWLSTKESHRVVSSPKHSGTDDEDLLQEALAAALVYEVSPGNPPELATQAGEKQYRFWHPLFAHYVQTRLSKPLLMRLHSSAMDSNQTQVYTKSHRADFADSMLPISLNAKRSEKKQVQVDSYQNAAFTFSPMYFSTAQKKVLYTEILDDFGSHERQKKREPKQHFFPPPVDKNTLSQPLFDTRQAKLIDLLTPKEHEILSLLSEGCSTVEIIQKLCLSKATVRTHIRNLLRKLEVSSRLSAVLLWKEYLASNDDTL